VLSSLLSFRFGSLKVIVEGVVQWNCVTRDTHKLGITERFVGHAFEYRFDVHVLNTPSELPNAAVSSLRSICSIFGSGGCSPRKRVHRTGGS